MGCAEGPSSSGVTARDSTGVRVIEYAGEPTPTRSITLSPEPTFRHGVRQEDYLFQRIGAGALQPDGGAVVVDAGSQEVVAIGPRGALRSVLARSGQGPGEVRRVMSVTVTGQDTALIEDDGNARLMVFVDGALSRTVSTAGDGALSRALRVVGVDDAGRPLMITSSFRTGFSEPWLAGRMVRLDPEGPTADTVASYDMVRSSTRGTENPFPPAGHVAGSGGRFVYSRSDVPELSWRSAAGELLQILRWSPARAFPTEADWGAFEAFLRESLVRVNPRMPPERVAGFVDDQLARYEVRYDEPLPLFMELFGDGEGGVWLADYSLEYLTASGFEFARLSAISPAGEWLGTVEMPPRFRLLDIAGGRALGVLRDDLDVQSVAVFELRVGEAGA